MAYVPSIIAKLLRLNDTHLEDVEYKAVEVVRYGEIFTKETLVVHARPYRRMQGLCPMCMKRFPGYNTKSAHERFWRHLDLRNVTCLIAYCPCRIQCPEHGVKTEYIPWSDGRSGFTADFNNTVAMLAHMPARKRLQNTWGLTGPLLATASKLQRTAFCRILLTGIRTSAGSV